MSDPAKCEPSVPGTVTPPDVPREINEAVGREVESPVEDVEWYANMKHRYDQLLDQTQQDITKRNSANALVDKLDAIFATHLQESLSIERIDRAARLEKERYLQEALRTKSIDAHYYGMNWLYEFPDAIAAAVAKAVVDSGKKSASA